MTYEYFRKRNALKVILVVANGKIVFLMAGQCSLVDTGTPQFRPYLRCRIPWLYLFVVNLGSKILNGKFQKQTIPEISTACRSEERNEPPGVLLCPPGR